MSEIAVQGRMPFTIRDRVLVNLVHQQNAESPIHLEEVRDYLVRLTQAQNPQDHDRSMDQLHVAFDEGCMIGRFLQHDGVSKEKMRVSDTGASQLARDVLPSRFFAGLRQLAQLNPHGGKLATLVWAKFSQTQEKVRMVRTVRMKLDGEAVRVIRSCHSQGYAPYSNLEFVQALLDHSEHFAEMPVLDWRVTDSAMRLRFSAIDEPLAVLRHWDQGALLDEPVPMVECWNSEVGLRRVGLRGGMWKMVCTNGMGHWDDRREWNWIHRGDSERIRQGVRTAYQDVLTSANGVVDAYKDALDVAIDDAFAWLEQEVRASGKGSDRIITAAQKGLTHPTTTPGGSLASVVDALTLVAQEENIFGQYEVERMAASVLRRGLSQSLKTEDRSITVGA